MVKTDLLAHDPDRWGHSLGNASEILIALLDAVEARSVLEIGAYAGDLTGEIVEWAKRNEASVVAIDPNPHYDLQALAVRTLCLELVRERSHAALEHVDVPDVAIVDGDHNYYTVHTELQLIAKRCAEGRLPLIVLHDVGWPHARRDTYFEPEEIPAEYRQPMVEGAHLVPEESGTTDRGLLFHWAAEREGGARNGVLTAVEDFVAEQEALRLAVLPVFFGIGVVWAENAPWAGRVAELLAPLDRNPVLEWLEANRVHNLARRNVMVADAGTLAQRVAAQDGEIAALQQSLEEQRALLRALLESRAFASADRLARLTRRGPDSWRELVRHSLEVSENGASD